MMTRFTLLSVLLGLLLLSSQASSLTTVAEHVGTDEHAAAAAAAAATSLRGRGGRSAKQVELLPSSFERTLLKLCKSIVDHHYQEQEQAKHDGDFARRLVAERNKQQRQLAAVVDSSSPMKNNINMDSVKEALSHLNAMQEEEQDNMGDVVLHLKSALANMNSLLQDSDNSSRQLHDYSGGLEVTGISGAMFQESIMGLIGAVQTGDKQALNMHGDIVKNGIQTAITKIYSALEDASAQEIEDFGQRVALLRNDPEMESIVANDPTAAVSLVTEALGRILDEIANGGTATSPLQLSEYENLVALMWMLPTSIVVGTFFWLFAGLWTYLGELTPLQIWIYEVIWVMDIIACAAGNDLFCLSEL